MTLLLPVPRGVFRGDPCQPRRGERHRFQPTYVGPVEWAVQVQSMSLSQLNPRPGSSSWLVPDPNDLNLGSVVLEMSSGGISGLVVGEFFMLFGAAVLVPVIIGYTAWAYWVFRGKVDPAHGYH